MVDETKEAPARHWVRWLTLAGSASLITLWVPSCLYDDSKVCGDDLEVSGDNERCVCPEGTFYSPPVTNMPPAPNRPASCIKCGPNQVLQGIMCTCAEGYVEVADGSCEVDPTSTSTSTGTSTATGTSATTGSTTGSTTGGGGESGAGGEGGEGGADGGANSTTDGGATETASTTETATSASSTTGSPPECTINDECAAGEICDAGACRPPTGFGDACAVPTDCTEEASFCDFIQYKCTVQSCTVAPDSCPASYDCCDLSSFGLPTLCIPEGACTP